jgi:hypothetical protein
LEIVQENMDNFVSKKGLITNENKLLTTNG